MCLIRLCVRSIFALRIIFGTGLNATVSYGWAIYTRRLRRFYQLEHVLGIRSLDVGSRTIAVKPDLGDLEWAEGAMALPEGGKVEVRVERNADGTSKLTVKAPPGIRVIK